MFFVDSTFLGIDPTAGEKPFVYAALDHELKLLALGEGSIDDVLAFAAGQSRAMAAVCAPRQANQGLMSDPGFRERLSPPPNPGRYINFRVAEYLLRQHNISIPQTPVKVEDCPNWMRMGFILFTRLAGLGYQQYPTEGAERQFIEIYPHACYSVLLERLPFPKLSLEGRLQRQLVLFELGINLPDPMRIFEEITQHRLLNGILPLEDLYKPGELDALVAAYTAWLAASKPGTVTLLGDASEGQVALPVAEPKLSYA
jgi:hypothetical protein